MEDPVQASVCPALRAAQRSVSVTMAVVVRTRRIKGATRRTKRATRSTRKTRRTKRKREIETDKRSAKTKGQKMTTNLSRARKLRDQTAKY